MRIATVLFLSSLCMGCIQLGSNPQPQQYLLLTPLAEINPIENRPVTLLFDQIEFPSYLSRPQLVTRSPGGDMQVSHAARWAEPLRENFSRVLREDLLRRWEGLRIVNYPWQPSDQGTILLRLSVNQFDGILGQQTGVDIRWTLIDTQNRQELVRKHFISTIPIGETPSDLALGLSQAAEKLSADVYEALTQHSPGSPQRSN